jgi:hypothetical protein
MMCSLLIKVIVKATIPFVNPVVPQQRRYMVRYLDTWILQNYDYDHRFDQDAATDIYLLRFLACQ